MPKSRRTTRLILLSIGLLVVIVPSGVMGPYLLRVRRFHAAPAAGYSAEFYLYVSPGAKRLARDGRQVTLLVQPNNSGTSSDDLAVHRKDAWWTAFGRHWLADDLAVVLLVPAFVRPGADWQIYTHALDRDVLTTQRPDLVRLDLQLLAMVDSARAALAADGMVVDQRFLIQGYSASGMFANRFTVLNPGRVKAVAAGSPGGWPIAPVRSVAGESLPYPAGVADLENLTGAPFDSAAYVGVPQLIVMGSLDDNDGLDFRDGWEEGPAKQVDRLFGADPQARWDDAEALYRLIGADAGFRLVDGVGHDRTKLPRYTTEFFREVLAADR